MLELEDKGIEWCATPYYVAFVIDRESLLHSISRIIKDAIAYKLISVNPLIGFMFVSKSLPLSRCHILPHVIKVVIGHLKITASPAASGEGIPEALPFWKPVASSHSV